MLITEIIKNGNNITVKDSTGGIVAVFPSNGTSSHIDSCKEDIIYLTETRSNRDIPARKFPIEFELVTTPAPPVGGWTRDLFLQELSDNFLNCPLIVDVGSGGGGISIDKTKLLQVDTVGNTTYLGYADAGSVTSGAVWAVKRIVESGNDVVITWADGDKDYNNIWDNRLALSYS